MRVALVHDFLTQLGGAEKVLDAFLEIYPKAPVFTLVYDKKRTAEHYEKYDIRPSFLQKMPLGRQKYKWYLALMPKAIESFDLSDYDLVLSDASAFAKGVITRKPAIHICYLHTPTRYLWSDQESYLKTAPIPFFIRPLMPTMIKYLQAWDLEASKGPDYYICNSQNVANRLKKYYHRAADAVIWPPVEASRFTVTDKIKDYYLIVSRLEPYKKIDLVIRVFNKLKLPLKIVGVGTNKETLRRLARPNIEFIGRIGIEELAKLYSEAQALVFPQEEDAGITLLESMASGRPVIAYRAGGALEVIQAGVTGEFFDGQSESSIIKAVGSFQAGKYQPGQIRQFALQLDKEVFKKKILKFIKERL